MQGSAWLMALSSCATMDRKSKAGSAGLGGNTWLTVLVLAAGALVLRETALEAMRPAANEARVEQRFTEQDIDARLWQDPFGAVARAREDLEKSSARKGSAETRGVIVT